MEGQKKDKFERITKTVKCNNDKKIKEIDSLS